MMGGRLAAQLIKFEVLGLKWGLVCVDIIEALFSPFNSFGKKKCIFCSEFW